jgi:DNA-binding CsgD family transcriptional regulator/PAS domain-containing protein
MGRRDDLLGTIEKIHAAGLEPTLWPVALAAVTRLIGGTAASLEVFDKRAFNHLEFHGFGIPSAVEIAYLADYIAENPRWVSLMPRQKAGDVGWDFQFIDEGQMNRDPFYAEFLRQLDMRYFLSGVLTASQKEYASISVQRSRRQGHPGRSEIALMGRLLPHVVQAYDVMRRLSRAGAVQHSLESTLDWLTDGVLAIRADGRVLHANAAARALARDDDGMRIGKSALEFSSPDARARLAASIGTIAHMRDAGPEATGASDFTVPRPSGAPSYFVSVRPLRDRTLRRDGAAALVFIHDPASRSLAVRPLLKEAFGLTDAEADLAYALREGCAPDAYARERDLSINTVYTHLSRLRAKTGTSRLSELIRKLNNVQAVAR